MDRKRVRVLLHDEAPRIGSGWRIVEVEVGRKWVRLKVPGGARTRLRRSIWEPIGAGAVELPAKRKRRKA